MACENPGCASHAREVREAFERFSSGDDASAICDEKTRALMTVALASVFRSARFTQGYVARALEAGAANEEVAQALLAAAAAGAADHTRLTRQVYDEYFDRLLAHFGGSP